MWSASSLQKDTMQVKTRTGMAQRDAGAAGQSWIKQTEKDPFLECLSEPKLRKSAVP